jgi:hypothetical protein
VFRTPFRRPPSKPTLLSTNALVSRNRPWVPTVSSVVVIASPTVDWLRVPPLNRLDPLP